MWFDIVKLDPSQIAQVQGDTEGKNISIEENKRCRDKIQRFEENLYSEFDYDPWRNTGFIHKEIPEKIYCKMVEGIDKFFTQEYKSEGIPNQTINKLSVKLSEYPNNYRLFIFSIKGNKLSYPFTMNLSLPKNLGLLDGHKELEMEFNRILNDEDYSITTKRYDKIKSCWERA